MGLFELLVAVGVLMLVTPLAYKFMNQEMNEVRYLSLSKQLKEIEVALMNYTSIEKNKWPNEDAGELKNNVRTVLIENYGMSDEVNEELSDTLEVRWFKNAKGEVEVFGLMNFDAISLDPGGLRKTLLYCGDACGFKDGEELYSATGAWAKRWIELGIPYPGRAIVVVRIDDHLLDTEYAAGSFLYRSSAGGAEGNRMLVDLSLGGHDILNAGLINADNLPAAEDASVPAIKFKSGEFASASAISGNLVLDGEFAIYGNASITAPTLDIKSNAHLKYLLAPEAVLYASTSSKRGSIEADGEARIGNLITNSLRVEGASDVPANPKFTTIRVSGAANASLGVIDSYALSAAVITVRNGSISSGDFDTDGGRMNLAPAGRVKIYNTKTNVSDLSGVDLDDAIGRFSLLRAEIEAKITNYATSEGVGVGQ
jgi:hypothetical protein